MFFFESLKLSNEFKDYCNAVSFILQKKALSNNDVFRVYCSYSKQKRNCKIDSKKAKKSIKAFLNIANMSCEPTLSKNCLVCKYYKRCFELLKSKDDISLISTLNRGEVNTLKNKGITTINQYSYKLKPSSLRANHQWKKYPSEIKALAIRESKTLFFNVSEFNLPEKRIYLDFETIPDTKLVYLCGLLIEKGNESKYEYFWLNDIINQSQFFISILERLLNLSDYAIYHYGSIDLKIVKSFLDSSNRNQKYSRILEQFQDVYSIIKSKIFFPLNSNSLREISDYLGFNSKNKIRNGLQSIYWKLFWDIHQEKDIKKEILNYNKEDCYRLRLLCEWLSKFELKDNIKPLVETSSDFKWNRVNFVVDSFNSINRCSYFNYQRQKVYIKTVSPVKNHINRYLKKKKIKTKTIELKSPSFCPECGGLMLYTHQIYLKELIDLEDLPSGFKAVNKKHITRRYKCKNCGFVFTPPEHKIKDRYGYTLKAWVINCIIYYRIKIIKIPKFLNELFCIEISSSQISRIKEEFALKYKEAIQSIKEELIKSNLIQIDETKVRLKNKSGYIFAITNMNSTIYLYRDTRETLFLEEFLKGFKGVLVSDFYSGYDRLECKKQKCLIHLIRDLNDTLLKFPFDEQLKMLCYSFGELLNEIICKVNKYG